jgi:hypothetical protein
MGNWYTKPQGGWTFSNDVLVNETGMTNSLHFTSIDKTFFTRKTYLYKTKIKNTNSSLTASNITLRTPWNTTLSNLSFTGITPSDVYMNFYSSPSFRINSQNNPDVFGNNYSYISFTASDSFTSNGIYEIDIKELDWEVYGYSWIESSGLTSGTPLSINNKSKGWSYNTYEDTEFFEFINNNSNNNPIGFTSSNHFQDPNFVSINYLTRYIDFSFFNLFFTTTLNDAEFKIYISDQEPYKGTITQSFTNWQNSSDIIATVTSATSSAFFGIKGNKYLTIVATGTQTPPSNIRIFGLRVEGGYGLGNNRQYLISATSSLSNFEPSDLSGVTFSSFIGIGDTFNTGNEPQISQIFSRIGNGAFESGMWENGVWNNGWREDDSVREFDDIDLSIRVRSDVRWRFRIVGASSSVSNFKLGDEITIGNIVSIDINEKRRLIRDRFRIIDINPTGINSRIGFIVVELDSTFPIRRIERDSKKHKIKVTKNGWLSGAFLNGYFTGVWNFGLFKGYPLITEMFNTNWIDGIFDGGHFQSEYFISGVFNDVFLKNNKLGLLFSTPHNLSVGDVIDIEMDDQTINKSYNGDATIIEVINDFEVVTDKDYGIKRNTSGGPINEIISLNPIQGNAYLSSGYYVDQFSSGGQLLNYVILSISESNYNRLNSIENGTISYSFVDNFGNNNTSTNNFIFETTIDDYGGSSVVVGLTGSFISFFAVDGDVFISPTFTISGILPETIQIIGSESGKFTSEIATSVIQNMKFNSNNISRVTSIDSLKTEDVFIYNSWIDVNYKNDSAVNVGRPQTKINTVSRKSISENNLYGYPTDDVLSSDSIFRDSYTLEKREYKLGNKWKLFNDYVGESSKFTEYFGTSSEDTQLFLDQGWTFSGNFITFSRTNDEGDTNITGQELKVQASLTGGVLDIDIPSTNINNRSLEKIEKDRYTVVEFDLVTYSVIPKTSPFNTQIYIPFIHFDNINTTKRKIDALLQDVPAEYLPIYRNIEHTETKKKRKIEYFFNKRNLSMNFTGGGDLSSSVSDYILNNLKIYEVDMIPFFQYFIDININRSIQIPYQGIAPYIDYESSDFTFIDNINIGLDSISVEATNDLFTGVGEGIVSAGFTVGPIKNLSLIIPL